MLENKRTLEVIGDWILVEETLSDGSKAYEIRNKNNPDIVLPVKDESSIVPLIEVLNEHVII